MVLRQSGTEFPATMEAVAFSSYTQRRRLLYVNLELLWFQLLQLSPLILGMLPKLVLSCLLLTPSAPLSRIPAAFQVLLPFSYRCLLEIAAVRCTAPPLLLLLHPAVHALLLLLLLPVLLLLVM